jgi:hypothetical protein
MELEIIMLNEISQSQKNKHVFPHMCNMDFLKRHENRRKTI